MDRLRQTAGKALVAFMLLMAGLTFLNSLLNQLTIPNVQKTLTQRGTLEKRFEGSGKLTAAENTPLYTQENLRVGKVHVEKGQKVQKGDPLITLEEAALQTLLGTCQAEYHKALQDYLWAKADTSKDTVEKYERAVAAVEKAEEAGKQGALENAIRNRDRITGIRNLLEKEEALKDKEEALGETRELYEKPTLFAPSDGTITAVNVKQGDATTLSALLTLAPKGVPLKLTVALSDEALKNLVVGDEAQITLSGKTYTCPIEALSQGEKGAEASFTLPENAGAPDVNAEARITKRTKSYDMLVPLSALYQDDVGYYVYTIETRQTALGIENTLRRADVTVLDKDATRAAIQGGISSSDTLVLRGDRALSSGDRIVVREN